MRNMISFINKHSCLTLSSYQVMISIIIIVIIITDLFMAKEDCT